MKYGVPDMKCTDCGSDNPANARFCGNCRQSLVEESAAGNLGIDAAELPRVDFGTAVKLGFQRYVDFSGRSTRAECWWWMLFTLVVTTALYICLLYTSDAADE